MQKILVGLLVKNFTFSILSSLKLNFSATLLHNLIAQLDCVQLVFRADTGNDRKVVNFTYSCLYARPIKVISVDNIIRNNHFYC